MLTYFVIYEPDLNGTPVGIFVRGNGGTDAIVWSHRQGVWRYDPAMAARFTADDSNWDRFQTETRQTAERVTPEITGGQPLPDEDTIRWIFQWKGKPPQSAD